MLKRFTVLAGLTLLLGMIAVPAAYADTRFSIQIGPGYWSPAPGPGYYWQDGYDAWTAYGYRWIPGRWVRGYRGRDRFDRRWERNRHDFYRNWNDRGSYRDRDDRYRDYDRDRRWDGDRPRDSRRDYERRR